MTPDTKESRYKEYLEAYPPEQRYALPVLLDLQDAFGYVPAQATEDLADYLGCPAADLYAITTFLKVLSTKRQSGHLVTVCSGTTCHLRGKNQIRRAAEAVLGIKLGETSQDGAFTLREEKCLGTCAFGPSMKIDDAYFTALTPEGATRVLERYKDGEDPEDIIASTPGAYGERPLYKAREHFDAHAAFNTMQQRVVLAGLDAKDPVSVEEYRAHGGYEGLCRALSMTPEAIVAEVEQSGIRGKGGAGFPTGTKWRNCLNEPAEPKYLICNGTEGDPGVYVDGPIMEGCPHAIIEGMAIGALAIGAEEGFLYVRSGYGKARERLQAAIDAALEAGILGDSVMGSGHKLHLRIVRSGGQYICGETTALMSSMAGKLPEARASYTVHSTQHGLFDQPTILNNAETLAAIPWIFREGAAAFRAIGTTGSTGTKVFFLTGRAANQGILEIPFGTTLRQLVFDMGGGVARGHSFKALLPGGPSDSVIPEKLLDTPIGFDELAQQGVQMGSGGMVVLDERDCMVEMARYHIDFLCAQSCGKCTPCREGLRQMSAILKRICDGQGRADDLEMLERLGDVMTDTALCALGQSAANPVLSSMRSFRDEWEEHVRDHHCRAGVCRCDALSEGGAA